MCTVGVKEVYSQAFRAVCVCVNKADPHHTTTLSPLPMALGPCSMFPVREEKECELLCCLIKSQCRQLHKPCAVKSQCICALRLSQLTTDDLCRKRASPDCQQVTTAGRRRQQAFLSCLFLT